MSFWDSIMAPLHWAISGILVLFHNVFNPLTGFSQGLTWFLAIVMMTVVVRTLMLPLYIRQLNSSRAMQTLQPKIQALQAKYGADRERLGQETMKLYQEEGINPMSSCLPLLIQMPIFFALFQVLNGASRGVPKGTFFVRNPELVDSLQNATVFGAKLSGTMLPLPESGIGPTQILSGVLVIAMTALLFWQQLHMMRRNMPPSALEGPMGQQQKMMLYMLPFMYVISGPVIPIGVLLYWLSSNIWTMGQQYIIIRTYPTPGTPAYVDWEDRMRAKGKDPVAIERERANKARKRSVANGATSTPAPSDGPARVVRQSGTPMRQTTRRPAVKDAAVDDASKANSQDKNQPTKNQRVQRASGSAKPSATTGQSSQESPQVIRQQPQRQTRAVRKKK